MKNLEYYQCGFTPKQIAEHIGMQVRYEAGGFSPSQADQTLMYESMVYQPKLSYQIEQAFKPTAERLKDIYNDLSQIGDIREVIDNTKQIHTFEIEFEEEVSPITITKGSYENLPGILYPKKVLVISKYNILSPSAGEVYRLPGDIFYLSPDGEFKHSRYLYFPNSPMTKNVTYTHVKKNIQEKEVALKSVDRFEKLIYLFKQYPPSRT